ncbi:MAG TPA: hypothetical protein VE863_12250, partial [Pyrinomonadaceae bacterium]|nr:hypothetical protein [Pyrinomonadaceae bacterium]
PLSLETGDSHKQRRMGSACIPSARFSQVRLGDTVVAVASVTTKSSGPDEAHPSLFDFRKKEGFRSTDFLSV